MMGEGERKREGEKERKAGDKDKSVKEELERV